MAVLFAHRVNKYQLKLGSGEGLWGIGYSGCTWKISQLSEGCFIAGVALN